MELPVGDRLADETGEWEVVGRPYTTNAGKASPHRLRDAILPVLSAPGDAPPTTPTHR
jgi:hypothetical protein